MNIVIISYLDLQVRKAEFNLRFYFQTRATKSRDYTVIIITFMKKFVPATSCVLYLTTVNWAKLRPLLFSTSSLIWKKQSAKSMNKESSLETQRQARLQVTDVVQ